jgi:hypothetical protein
MSIEVLKSTGQDRAEMNGMVKQHRQMTRAYEMVLADHWDVEDLACSIEDLAARIQAIRDLAAQIPSDGSPISQFAQAIETTALPTHPKASEVLKIHLGLTDPTPAGHKLLLSDKPIYGHPRLRWVTHAEINEAHRSMEYSSYLVNPATGAVQEVEADETVEDAIARRLIDES